MGETELKQIREITKFEIFNQIPLFTQLYFSFSFAIAEI